MTRVFIYGTGNMAWALTRTFEQSGLKVSGIFGHSYENAQAFAKHFNIPAYADPQQDTAAGDVVLLAIKDDALPGLNRCLRLPGRHVFHTAGSVDLAAIADISESVGVLYPLQRVRKFAEPELQQAPVCVEVNNETLAGPALALAGKLSKRVLRMDSEQRRKAHLAAVFVSNFSNFMLVMGNEVLKNGGLPSDLLDPLLKDAFRDISLGEAAERQTGPARRGDLKVIQAHLQQLENQPALEALYRLVSFEILKYYNPSA